MRRKEVIFRISNFFDRLSIDLSIFRSILVDFSKPGRFLTKIRIRGFSGALNRMAMFVFLENRYLWSNRSIRLDSAELIASGRLFESLSILDQTSDMGVFGGR